MRTETCRYCWMPLAGAPYTSMPGGLVHLACYQIAGQPGIQDDTGWGELGSLGPQPNWQDDWKPNPLRPPNETAEADSRDGQPARRCQVHNQLMEPLGHIGHSLAYFCAVEDAVQLKAV